MKRWKVFCVSTLIAAALLGIFIGLKHGFNSPPHRTDLITFWDEGNLSPDPTEVQHLKEDLKAVIIPEVKFIEKPLVECLNFVLERLNQDGEFDGRVRYRFLVPDETLNTKIPIRFRNAGAGEVIRYVTLLAQITFSVGQNGEILIIPRHYGWDTKVTTKFSVPPGFSTLIGDGPYDIRGELARVLFENDTAEYFPDKGVVIVSTTVGQILEIDAYLDAFNIPTLFEKIGSKVRRFFKPRGDPFAAP